MSDNTAAPGFKELKKSRHSGSNRGPTVYKTVALPLSYAGKTLTINELRQKSNPLLEKSNPHWSMGTLKHIGECLYRTQDGAYVALIKVGGKQIKRHLQTKDGQLTKRWLEDSEAKATNSSASRLRPRSK